MRQWAKRAVLTRIICALAVFMLGFADHAVANPALDPASPQYVLPDGTYAAICHPGDDKGGVPHDGSNHCDSCVMAGGHLFTPPETEFADEPAPRHGETVRRIESANLNRILSYHSLSRGPPLVA